MKQTNKMYPKKAESTTPIVFNASKVITTNLKGDKLIVSKQGNGAVIRMLKKDIGKRVVVLVL